MKPETFPIAIKRGSAVVMVYHTPTRNTNLFTLSYWQDGKRYRPTFADLDKAKREASTIATRLSSSDADVLTLTSEDRAAYLHCLEVLKPSDITLESAVVRFADAHKRLAGRSISEAVEFFLKRHPGTLPSKTVQDAAADFIEFTRQAGASDVYLKDLGFRLGKFSDAFHCQIASVMASEINAFLRALDCQARGKANYKGAIRTLFKFAAKEKWLPKDHIDWADVDSIKAETGEIQIFKPSEMAKLLDAAQLSAADLAPGFNLRYATGQGLLPLLVLGGFAGLRTAEVQRQLWTDINLERGFIRVTAAKGNTAQKRLVPISANLRAWLLVCKRDSGTCCDYPRPNEAIARLAKRAGVEWKHNAFRHSFISYRVAETQDVAKASLEAGNSPKMIHRHYRELVTPAEAMEWFSISPARAANVEAMPAAAAA